MDDNADDNGNIAYNAENPKQFTLEIKEIHKKGNYCHYPSLINRKN